MFIDLAMLEAELSSLNGVRAGQRSRDKKATCPTCSRGTVGGDPALAHHMYTALTPSARFLLSRSMLTANADGPVPI